MKEIHLSKGRTAFVDDDDYPLISQYKWYFNCPGGYARTTIGGKRIYMHRLVMKAEGRRCQIDHINGNKLDNQKENLRFATCSQNQANIPKYARKCTSVYRGVCYEPMSTSLKKWRASIMANSKRIYLGHFRTEREAALAYNNAAIKYFGEYAKLNLIEKDQL